MNDFQDFHAFQDFQDFQFFQDFPDFICSWIFSIFTRAIACWSLGPENISEKVKDLEYQLRDLIITL